MVSNSIKMIDDCNVVKNCDIIDEYNKHIVSRSNSYIRKIGDYYYEKKSIGTGTYGKVYMAWKKNDENLYVIKKIEKNIISMNEILNLKQIKESNGGLCYSNILCYHDHIEELNDVYLITVYKDDVMDMFDFLDFQINKLTIKEKVIIINNIANALKIIHDLQIAHSDLKPENILINPSNLDIQLIDFGGSCNGKYFDRCGITGTVEFSSPELLNALLDDKYRMENIEKYIKSDVFSLGLIFYLLINNNMLPVDTIKVKDNNLKIKHLIKKYAINIQSNSGYRIIDDLINKMLLFDYTQRPSINWVLERLEEILVTYSEIKVENKSYFY